MRSYFALLILSVLLSACNPPSPEPKPVAESKPLKKPEANPVGYFEIPVTNMDRAEAFYATVFNLEMHRQTIDGYEMSLFPFDANGFGASGALAKGDVYVPSKMGVVIYFSVKSIDETLKVATQNGASVLYPKKSIGEMGFVAEFEDSEGNRIALHQNP
jgi:uncharacterized protein